MKRVIFLILLAAGQLLSQAYQTAIAEILNQASLDTLVKHVRLLSGEDSLYIDGSKYLIKNRSSGPGYHETIEHQITAKYIVNTLRKYGHEAAEYKYPRTYNYPSGTWTDTLRNIIGVAPGHQYPDKKIILSAHYDTAVLTADDDQSLAPGADNNASGVAVVLEAARLLVHEWQDYSIMFIFWDWVEQNFLASELFLSNDTARTDIIAMLNLQMLGFNADSSNILQVYCFEEPQHHQLAELASNLNDLYQIGLNVDTVHQGNGVPTADFWYYNICPVNHFEQHWANHNPNWLKVSDTIGAFNFDYFLKNAKLAIATTAEIAMNGFTSSKVTDQIESLSIFRLFQNHPNPFNATTTLRFNLPSRNQITLKVFDLKGKSVFNKSLGIRESGLNQYVFDGSNFSSGIYFYRLETSTKNQTGKMVLIK
ncbi:MAG: M28 family peptidase [Candidatus Neomarinimicrobiota bacterium]